MTTTNSTTASTSARPTARSGEPSATAQTSPEARLEQMSMADEQAHAAATFEPARRVERYAAFNPPKLPTLMNEDAVSAPADKAIARERNRDALARYNAQYAAYLARYVDGIEQAPSAEHIRLIGPPVGYDPVGGLKASQRAQYDRDLLPAASQNAVSVYQALEMRRLAEAGERGPLDIGIKASVEVTVGGVKAGGSRDGTKKEGERGDWEVGFEADARALHEHFNPKAPDAAQPHSYVKSEAQLADAKTQTREKNVGKPSASFNVSVNKDGEVEGEVGLSVGSAFGASYGREDGKTTTTATVFGSSAKFKDGALDSVTADLKLAKVSFDGDTLKTQVGVEESVQMLGLEGKVEAKVATAFDGDAIELEAAVGGGIEGVLCGEVSAAANVNMVDQKWIRHALTSNGFFR